MTDDVTDDVTDGVTDDWATVVVVVEPDEYDVVTGLLWDAGVAGVEEIPQADGRVELRAGCRSAEVERVRRTLTEGFVAARALAVSVESVAADAGLDEWRDHATAWRAGARFVVVPAWQPPPDWITGADIVLVVDPAHAFGSGSHPTTRACLAAIERRVRPGDVVADVGCGSGVLAVAAARRGAVEVRAVDIDPQAVVATTANAARNGVGPLVHASRSGTEHLAPHRFDVVVANIGAATLCESAPMIGALPTPEGVLVLSGVLASQVDAVDRAYAAHGFVVERTESDGDWCTLELRRADRAD